MYKFHINCSTVDFRYWFRDSFTLFLFCTDMVKNKGFLPSGPSEIPVQRNQMKEIIYSLLPACTEPDVDTRITFKADAIIANPPAYG